MIHQHTSSLASVGSRWYGYVPESIFWATSKIVPVLLQVTMILCCCSFSFTIYGEFSQTWEHVLSVDLPLYRQKPPFQNEVTAIIKQLIQLPIGGTSAFGGLSFWEEGNLFFFFLFFFFYINPLTPNPYCTESLPCAEGLGERRPSVTKDFFQKSQLA